MQNKFFPALFYLILSISLSVNKAKAGIDTTKFGNVYFTGIGNNDLTSVGIPYKFQFSEADILRLKDFFEKDIFFTKNPAENKFFSYSLLGNKANLVNLGSVMDTLARKATKEDVFIFYYNGVVGKINGDSLNAFGLAKYKYSKETVTDKSIYNTMLLADPHLKSQLTTQWLKNKIDLIPCENILIIIDANSADKIAYDLMNDLSDKNTLLYKLKGKKIRFIYPEGGLIGESFVRQSGDFAYSLSKSPDAGLENFLLDVAPILSGKLSAAREKINYGQFVYVSDFEQFLAIKTTVLKDVLCDNSRSEVVDEDNTPGYTKKNVVNYALLIGTDNYEAQGWRHLNNPVFDAKSMRDILKEHYGFETNFLTDPRGDEILQAIDDIRTNIKFDSVYSQLFIFIAGHGGWEESAPGYIVPKDALPKEKDKFRRSYISLASIRSILSNINCPHILIVIDACYGGTFDELISNSSGPRSENELSAINKEFVERTLKPRSRLYLTSGGKEKVDDGTPNSHSPFAKILLNELELKYQLKQPLHFDVLKGKFIDSKLKPEPRSGFFDNTNHQPGGAFIFIPK